MVGTRLRVDGLTGESNTNERRNVLARQESGEIRGIPKVKRLGELGADSGGVSGGLVLHGAGKIAYTLPHMSSASVS